MEDGDRRHIAPRPLLVATLWIVLFSAAFGYHNGVSDGHLVDTDSYSWLTRAAELRTSGVWFDDTLDDVYPPLGHKQHWSRPFDVLLLAGAVVGEPVAGFDRALFGWAIVLPLVLGVATAWLLWWGFADVLDTAGRDAFPLLFSLQPAILAGFMAGRADHQALIGVLIVWTLGYARRAFSVGRTNQVVAAAVLSALGLWVGTEFAIVVAAIYVVLAVDWVRRNDEAMRHATTYSVALASAGTVALLIENGPSGLWTFETDELSLVFLGSIAIAGVAAAMLGALRPSSWLARVLGVIAAGTACAVAITRLFPSALRGPLGSMDPLYEATRLASIAELQPLLSTSTARMSVIAAGLSLLPLALYAALTHVRDQTTAMHFWRSLRLPLTASALYLPLAVAQVRWLFALNLVLVIPATVGVQRLMHRAAPRAERVHIGMISVAALAALWWVPFQVADPTATPPLCDTNAAIATLNDAQVVDANPQRVMTAADFGPEILFRTSHHVYSIPNHRPQPGYRATFEIMTETDPSVARQQLAAQRVDLLLVCSDARVRRFYGADPDSFHTALTSGDVPSWLTELPASETEPRFRLYRIDL